MRKCQPKGNLKGAEGFEEVQEGSYCAFFTLTGASLELDIMVHAFAIACVLVVSRIVALFVGSYYGGIIAGESKEESKYSGFCYITQAGVTLGLAKEVHLNFPGW